MKQHTKTHTASPVFAAGPALLVPLLSILFLCPAPLCAAEAGDELAPGFNACVERSGGSTPQMAACGQAAYEYWDKRLNDAYKKARQACFDDACRDRLQNMQRLWVQYKEAMGDVLFRGLERVGGSVNRLDAVAFSAEETKKQTELLRDLLRSSGAAEEK